MENEPLPQALLVIDMQKDFFAGPELAGHRDGVVAACNTAVRKAHQAGAIVFEVRTVHSADRSSWSLNMLRDGQGMTIESTSGAAPVEGLLTPGATVVEKTRDSAFHGTELAERLDDQAITSIAICGVSTESCIAMTASEAYARDLHVTLVSDALASVDPHAHDNALDRLSQQYRQTSVTAQQIQFETREAM